MGFGIDQGAQGADGPFIHWSARGTQDGEVPARSFYLRDGTMKKPIDLSKGVAMDLDTLKTGWQQSGGVKGVAPKWVWGSSPALLPEQPGDDYKKGFSIRVALGPDKTATWEQAGAGAWNGLIRGLGADFDAGYQPGLVPVVRMADARLEQYGNNSTVVPVLEIVKWIERPDTLKGKPIAQEAAPAAAASAAAPAAQEDDAFAF